MIAALSRNRCIGRDGDLPWHYPEDLKHFKRTTRGHTVIMGRKTYESLGKPLAGRHHVVLTRDPSFDLSHIDFEPGMDVVTDLQSGLELAWKKDSLPFVLGGGTIYTQALPQATELHLTWVDEQVDGDTFFPQFDASQWEQVESRAGENSALRFEVLRRRPVQALPR